MGIGTGIESAFSFEMREKQCHTEPSFLRVLYLASSQSSSSRSFCLIRNTRWEAFRKTRQQVINSWAVWYSLSSYKLREERNPHEQIGPTIRRELQLELALTGGGRIGTYGGERAGTNSFVENTNSLKVPLSV